ncbi:MAG TPA: S53 family peptidase [Terriglobales bacterium]|nr:S53 family peptidase [Terriglobales bacterium]
MKKVVPVMLVLVCFAALGTSQTITNNTPGFISNAIDAGPVNPANVIEVTVWLQLHNQQQLDQLVQSQHQSGSKNYHKWLNQAQFDTNFSPKPQEVRSLSNFLSAHNLTVESVAENNWYVKVLGTVAAVEKAFHVQIDNYNLNGITYRSNTANPSINNLTGAHVAAISGLDDYGFQPALAHPTNTDGNTVTAVPLSSVGPDGLFYESHCFTGIETDHFSGNGNTATYTGNRYGAPITNTALGHLAPCGYQPSEIQTAYDMKPLYAAGLTGVGQTVVITDAFGSPTIAQDAELFSQLYGLPDITPANFQIVKAPGLVNNGDTKNGVASWAVETSLDVEWVHAMAPGANIALITATNRGSLDEAINLAVVHNLGNVISNSWSTREGLGNPAQFDRINRILEQAAAKGIDVNFASGDCGDNTVPVAGFCGALPFKTVDFPASSPFATGVGGTSLALNPNDTIAFQTGWGTNFSRIANPAPVRGAFGPPVFPIPFGFQGGAGGGSSLTFAKPDFQSNIAGSTRQVPDIAMLADPQTGVEVIQTVGGQTFVEIIGGTSLATPMFSGVMAVASQKAGGGLGQAAALLYDLPAAAIADVGNVDMSGNVTGTFNGQPLTADQLAAPLDGVTNYYSALFNSDVSTRWDVFTFGTDTSLQTAPGYDNVTGLGTPNGAAFVNALVP